MLHNPLELTPFRPAFTDILTTQSWSGCEIVTAVVVMYLSFLQKKHDGNKPVTDIIGFIGYMSLVLKVGFGFLIVWDGVYVALHAATEPPRAIATTAMCVLALQQVRDLLGKITAKRILSSRSVELLPNEVPHSRMPFEPGLPQWVLFLVDTEEWARALVPRSIRRR